MGTRGRNTPAYRAARRRFQQGDLLCHMCRQRPGTTPDHVPALETAPTPEQWRGQLLPACRTCQSRQGQAITTRLRYGGWSY